MSDAQACIILRFETALFYSTSMCECDRRSAFDVRARFASLVLPATLSDDFKRERVSQI